MRFTLGGMAKGAAPIRDRRCAVLENGRAFGVDVNAGRRKSRMIVLLKDAQRAEGSIVLSEPRSDESPCLLGTVETVDFLQVRSSAFLEAWELG